MIKTGNPVISIYTEMTPNPETMKFVANKLLYPGKSIDFQFSVWKCEVKQAGTVTLGGLKPPADRTQGFNMYGLAAMAEE